MVQWEEDDAHSVAVEEEGEEVLEIGEVVHETVDDLQSPEVGEDRSQETGTRGDLGETDTHEGVDVAGDVLNHSLTPFPWEDYHNGGIGKYPVVGGREFAFAPEEDGEDEEIAEDGDSPVTTGDDEVPHDKRGQLREDKE